MPTIRANLPPNEPPTTTTPPPHHPTLKGREIISKHGFADARWEAVDNDDAHVSRKFGDELERQAPRIAELHTALHFTSNKCLSRKPIVDPVNTGKEHKVHGTLVAQAKF